jgi:hypothetical protein
LSRRLVPCEPGDVVVRCPHTQRDAGLKRLGRHQGRRLRLALEATQINQNMRIRNEIDLSGK